MAVEQIKPRIAERPKSAVENGEKPRRHGLGYGVIEHRADGSIGLALKNHRLSAHQVIAPTPEDVHVSIHQGFQDLAKEAEVKNVVAVGFKTNGFDHEYQRDIDTRRNLWKKGIVPIDLAHTDGKEVDLLDHCATVQEKFTDFGTAKVEVDSKHGRVSASRIATLEDYKDAYHETGHEQFYEESMDKIEAFAKKFAGWKLVRINTTPQAGGVAGMLQPAVRFIDEYNRLQNKNTKNGESGTPIDFRWHVMNGHIDPEIAARYGVDLKDPKILELYGNPEKPEDGINVFKITKKMHNIIQGVSKPEDRLTAIDKKIHSAWTETQAERLQDVLQMEKTVYWIDDQQPVGLIEKIVAQNPDAPILYRSHIQFRSDLAAQDGTPQSEVVEFLVDKMAGPGRKIDAFLSHRSRDEDIDGFLPKTAEGNVDPRLADKVMYKVATADQVDGLGKRLTPEQQDYQLSLVNEYLEETGQRPLDMTVGHWGQFARFDDAKDDPGVLKSQLLLSKKMLEAGVPIEKIPECLVVGFGATDDPDGERVLKEVDALRLSPEFALIKDKIKLIRLTYDKYDDQAMKALEEICDINTQLSLAEGCEDKITQHLQDGRKVIVADTGGMPPQIIDGLSGHLVNPRDYEAVSGHLFDYYMNIYPDPEKRVAASMQAKANVNQEYTTLANIRDMLGIAVVLKDKKEQLSDNVTNFKAEKAQYPFVKDIIDQEYEELCAAETQEKLLPVSADVYVRASVASL